MEVADGLIRLFEDDSCVDLVESRRLDQGDRGDICLGSMCFRELNHVFPNAAADFVEKQLAEAFATLLFCHLEIADADRASFPTGHVKIESNDTGFGEQRATRLWRQSQVHQIETSLSSRPPPILGFECGGGGEFGLPFCIQHSHAHDFGAARSKHSLEYQIPLVRLISEGCEERRGDWIGFQKPCRFTAAVQSTVERIIWICTTSENRFGTGVLQVLFGSPDQLTSNSLSSIFGIDDHRADDACFGRQSGFRFIRDEPGMNEADNFLVVGHGEDHSSRIKIGLSDDQTVELITAYAVSRATSQSRPIP